MTLSEMEKIGEEQIWRGLFSLGPVKCEGLIRHCEVDFFMLKLPRLEFEREVWTENTNLVDTDM